MGIFIILQIAKKGSPATLHFSWVCVNNCTFYRQDLLENRYQVICLVRYQMNPKSWSAGRPTCWQILTWKEFPILQVFKKQN